ncbi:MAG TPA: hypothetical protein VNU44_01840 [Bryobacteraceae bacterium]|jgi:hypothetical protein|nr:hypothetical protein [Bryobacteraceae bacterium]
MKILISLAICACAWAQVQRPQIGKMLDANGAVRTVYGIASSVTLGAAEITDVLSSGCSNALCLAKTDAGIVSASGIAPTPAGPALFAFDGATAWVWFTESRQLAQWSNGTLALEPRPSEAVSVRDPYGEVLSIGASSGSVQFVVRRFKGDVWIVNQDGSVAGALPRAAGAVMLIPGGAVYATRSGIAIHNLEIPLEGVTAFSWMSASYLQVRAGGSIYALRIDPGRETLFQLPGVQQ